ncbi:hypothetical protein [Actinosynnema sp. ALI-1.44]|nr:hypothetical protein [Actinosynnema sp. ALI-1.44]
MLRVYGDSHTGSATTAVEHEFVEKPDEQPQPRLAGTSYARLDSSAET